MKKSNKGKMPAGAPKGMNPLTFFAQENAKKQAMMQKGGYNTPKNLPRKDMGGMNGSSAVASVSSNPFAKGNGLTPITPSMTSSRPTSTSGVTPRPVPTPSPTPAPVSVTPTPAPVTVPAAKVSFKEQKKAMKESGKLERLEAKNNLKKAKLENLKKQYESGDRKAATVGDKIDRAVKVGETVIQGIDAVNKFRKPIGGGGSGFDQKGGSVKRKSKKK